MQLESWLAFASIALIATITPGPAVLLVSAHSLQEGPLRSVMTIAGNVTGLFTMSACSVLGLSTLILVSATAFTVVKLIGAAYLVFLGIKLWRNGVHLDKASPRTPGHTSLPRLYGQGLLVALTNPKAIIFTTALFPQFIQVSEPLIPQFSLLVITFMLFSFVCLLGYALLAHKAKHHSSIRVPGELIGKLFGAIFVGVGALLATTSNK